MGVGDGDAGVLGDVDGADPDVVVFVAGGLMRSFARGLGLVRGDFRLGLLFAAAFV